MEQDDGPSTNSDTEFAPRDEDGDEDDDLLGERGDGQGQQRDAGRGAVGGRRRNDGAEWTDTMSQGPLPEFTATPGVTVNLDDDEWFKPLGIFKLFVTDAMMDQACRQTNLYWSQIEAERGDGNSRPWALLTTEELWPWLGILATNSCHPYPSRLLGIWPCLCQQLCLWSHVAETFSTNKTFHSPQRQVKREAPRHRRVRSSF